MFITFKKWTALYVLCFVLLFAAFAAILWRGGAVNASKNVVLEGGGPALLIDPGHGGEDGGAVAADGATEAEINLAVSLELESLARLLGVDAAMTRREDVSLGDPALPTVRQRKTDDLKNRTEAANALPEAVTISIHQNTLPGFPEVHGAQVFHGGGERSARLAQAVQDALNAAVNDAAKEIKTAQGVYLLSHAQGTAVLVECGFLSNSRETAALKTEDHQKRLAVSILAPTMAFLTAEEV